jgi:hypothetical protein
MKINQKGFSLVEGLLTIIALSLVVFVGFYVYSNRNKANDTLDTATTESTKSATPAKTGYLDVKELGVKIPLNSKLTGLNYTISPTDNSMANLSTDKFDQAVNACQSTDAASGSAHEIGDITKVSGQYDPSAMPNDFFAEFSKQFSGFYLTYGTPDGGVSLLCSDKTPTKVQAVEDIFNSVSPALKAAVKNAQLIQ